MNRPVAATMTLRLVTLGQIDRQGRYTARNDLLPSLRAPEAEIQKGMAELAGMLQAADLAESAAQTRSE